MSQSLKWQAAEARKHIIFSLSFKTPQPPGESLCGWQVKPELRICGLLPAMGTSLVWEGMDEQCGGRRPLLSVASGSPCQRTQVIVLDLPVFTGDGQ